MRYLCAQAAQKDRYVRHAAFFAQTTYRNTDRLCHDAVKDYTRVSGTLNTRLQFRCTSVPNVIRDEQSYQNRGINGDIHGSGL